MSPGGGSAHKSCRVAATETLLHQMEAVTLQGTLTVKDKCAL